MRYILSLSSNFIILLLILLLAISSCRMPNHTGFNQPITLDVNVPEGSAEYKTGWHNGCKSGLGMGSFGNSFIYDKGPDVSNGIYQHDSEYQIGWSHGWFSCILHSGTFTANNSSNHAPLQ